MTEPSDPAALALQRTLLARALAAGDPGCLYVRFRAEVSQRYRERSGAQVVRTRSVGRIAIPGRSSLDVGIAAHEGEVHVPVQDLIERLPEDERPHWIEHLVETPASTNFLSMRQAAGACIDDGETGAWEA